MEFEIIVDVFDPRSYDDDTSSSDDDQNFERLKPNLSYSDIDDDFDIIILEDKNLKNGKVIEKSWRDEENLREMVDWNLKYCKKYKVVEK
jgi:hypothetical protein